MRKKRKNLKINITNIYIIIALFFIVGFVFFGTSKLFMTEEIPINETKINEEYDLRSNGKFKISKWIYDPDKNKMEIVLITNGIKDYKTELNFSSVTRKNIGKELPVEIIYNDNEIYIIQINNVENGFQQLALRLHRSEKDIEDIFDEENKNITENEQLVSTIYTDERVVDIEVLNEKESNEYVKEITDELIKEATIDIEKEEQSIDKSNELIESINDEISNLEKELLYQTIDEQIDTNNQIYRLNNEINELNKSIEEKETNIKNLQTKTGRLEQKKRDIQL